MTDLEKNLLTVLVELDTTIKNLPTASPKPNLQSLFPCLDNLTRELPKNADPNLLHYLHKKSYQKARLFLEGRDPENAEGNCRHV